MPRIEQILLVGHCGADAFSLKYIVQQAAGDAELDVRSTSHSDDRVAAAGPETLLLINRELGGILNRKTGVELIRELKQKPDPPQMMLISNYENAQQDAVDAGASPGFGKSQLHDPQTLAKLEAVLADASSG